jgi:copper chaperone NosL
VRPRAVAAAALALAAGCGGGEPQPADIDTRNDACAWCRMAISDARFAAQVVGPREEPRLFDDIGCLRDWLDGGAEVPPRAVAWVADHRTRAWVRAAEASYARVPGLATPMASGLVAHASAASREADPEAAGGAVLTAREVFGGARVPGGGP